MRDDAFAAAALAAFTLVTSCARVVLVAAALVAAAFAAVALTGAAFFVAVARVAPAFAVPVRGAALAVAALGVVVFRTVLFTARPVVARATGSGFVRVRRGCDTLFLVVVGESAPDLARPVPLRAELRVAVPAALAGARVAARAALPVDRGEPDSRAAPLTFPRIAAGSAALVDCRARAGLFAAVLEVTCRIPSR
ncbi:MAG TPA: hypothetical protein VK047_02845 [Zeimonas sp.]|nr:hypothetical protein [Zeimonas sp.]